MTTITQNTLISLLQQNLDRLTEKVDNNFTSEKSGIISEIQERHIHQELVSENSAIVSEEHRQIEVVESEVENCYICLEILDTNRNFIALNCGHKLHFECFIRNAELGQSKNNCGYCRRKIISDELKREIEQTKITARNARNVENRRYEQELRDRYNQRRANHLLASDSSSGDDSSSDDDSDSEDEVIVRINNGIINNGIRRRNLNMQRRRRRAPRRNARVLRSERLVVSVLNRRNSVNNQYQTIREISNRLAGNLGDATIRTRINELLANNRVEVGLGNNRSRNYRLV